MFLVFVLNAKTEAFLVAIVQDYYRCTNCGEDTRQFVNGVIKYMKLNNEDKEFIKKNGKKSQPW
jgi:hypothetical protein